MEKFVIKNIEFIDESEKSAVPKTNLNYNGIEINIAANREESLKHVKEDYEVLTNQGIEKLIKEYFIPWLKTEDFKNLDDEEIYKGLKLYSISYQYDKHNDKHSPTGKEDFFGEFEFDFESGNEYTKNLLEASAFVLLVNNGQIFKGRNFDI